MSKKLTQEIFIEKVNQINPDIEVLGEYINMETKIKFKCKKDNFEWETSPRYILIKKHGCPKCGKSLKLDTNIFKEQMLEINPNIEILGEYVNSDTPIRVRCKECNYFWNSRPYHLKNNKGCPKCAIKKLSLKNSKNLEDFKKELKIINPNIEIIGEYKNEKTKIKYKCLKCGKLSEATPDNLLRGRGCPYCATSKGEEKIKKWLEFNHFDYIKEYKFNDCKDKRALPFDFYLPTLNKIIEFDGPHHFIPIRYGNIDINTAKNKLKEVQKRDKIKDEYCKNNNIDLLRISYRDFKGIENILTNFLK